MKWLIADRYNEIKYGKTSGNEMIEISHETLGANHKDHLQAVLEICILIL